MKISVTSLRDHFGSVASSGVKYIAGELLERTELNTSAKGRHMHIVRARHPNTEVRGSVHDSHSPTIAGNDLVQALAALGGELASKDSATFRLVVEGRPRALPPILQHEFCQIASQVVRNAFGHAHARQIEAEVRYGARLLRLRIRDDGKGIAASDSEDGYRELRGINDYVKRIGGRLDVWGGGETGSEVELTIPAFIAFPTRYRNDRHQAALELNVRLEERTRIARDLHDTLLQSFQGLILRFQAAYNLLPERPAEGLKTLESAIDHAAKTITEGRDIVQGLRSPTAEADDLALAIKALGEEFESGEISGGGVEFFVDVEGTPRDLHPIIQDEIYRIAGEALCNAFRHSQARRIEVAIGYGERRLRLCVRDNGKGINPEILGEHGRAGHWGLAGMSERAELIGGHLEVWSELRSGTEVDLTIPAYVAYKSASSRRLQLFKKRQLAKTSA